MFSMWILLQFLFTYLSYIVRLPMLFFRSYRKNFSLFHLKFVFLWLVLFLLEHNYDFQSLVSLPYCEYL